MKIDLYTKSVLTVIALCLLYLCAGGAPVITKVQAQPQATDVVIVGWRPAGQRAISPIGVRGLPVHEAGQ